MAISALNEEISPLKEEVRERLKNKGIPLIRIAERLGMKQQAFDYHVRGKGRINPGVYARIKQAVRDIEKEFASMSGRAEHVQGNFYPVLKSFQIINGTLDTSPSNIAGYFFFQYPKPDGCYGIVFHGDQMISDAGSSIYDEDILLIDEANKVINGDIALVILKNGRELIRQYINENGEIILRSKNTKYPDIKVNAEEIAMVLKVAGRQPKPEIYA